MVSLSTYLDFDNTLDMIQFSSRSQLYSLGKG
jgi:hypothetical protein